MRVTNEHYADAKVLEQIEVGGLKFLVVKQRFGGQESATHTALLRSDRVAVALAVNNGGGYPDWSGLLRLFVEKHNGEAELKRRVKLYDPPLALEETLLLPPEPETGLEGAYQK